MRGEMKYNKMSGLYKGSNVTFNEETREAKSYNWWMFVKLVNGKVVFNNYFYSSTTNRHQAKVRQLLNDLGITIDYFVELKGSLSGDWQGECLRYAEKMLKTIKAEEAKGRVGTKASVYRLRTIAYYEIMILNVQTYGLGT